MTKVEPEDTGGGEPLVLSFLVPVNLCFRSGPFAPDMDQTFFMSPDSNGEKIQRMLTCVSDPGPLVRIWSGLSGLFS